MFKKDEATTSTYHIKEDDNMNLTQLINVEYGGKNYSYVYSSTLNACPANLLSNAELRKVCLCVFILVLLLSTVKYILNN